MLLGLGPQHLCRYNEKEAFLSGTGVEINEEDWGENIYQGFWFSLYNIELCLA